MRCNGISKVRRDEGEREGGTPVMTNLVKGGEGRIGVDK